MSRTHFKFKQFSIRHDTSTMKVGTDAVLLGAWADVANARSVLDIGTGSGVIAIMIAQRTSAECIIDGVEIQQRDADQAKENVSGSPWKDKVRIHHTSVQQFPADKQYDVIVSNPPYFINSLEPPDEKRRHTRHTVLLTFQDLLAAARRLIKPDGKLNVILPFAEGNQFAEMASEQQWHCIRRWTFRSRNNKPVERWLFEFSLKKSETETGEIILYEQGEVWSEGYKKLTQDFYLKG